MGPLSREELEPTLRPLHEASMLPPRVYVDETVAAWEAERLFLDGWVCAGHVSTLAARGAYLTREVGGESLLVIGDDDGRPRTFFNVCRHRGHDSSKARRGRCGGSSARTTRGPTASTGRCATRRTPMSWRTSTRRASASRRCAAPWWAGSSSSTSAAA